MSYPLSQLSLGEYAAFRRELELLNPSVEDSHPECSCTTSHLTVIARDYLSRVTDGASSLGTDRNFVYEVVQLMRDDLRSDVGGKHRRLELLLAPLALYLPSHKSCAEHASELDPEESVEAFLAAVAAQVPHLEAFYVQRFLEWRNGCVEQAVEAARTRCQGDELHQNCASVHVPAEVIAYREEFEVLSKDWGVVPVRALDRLLRGLHPEALARTQEAMQLLDEDSDEIDWSSFWDALAPAESAIELGLPGAVERWLSHELRLGEGLSLATQAWIERFGHLLVELDLSEISANIDDGLVTWLISIAPKLEALNLSGCYHVSDGAFAGGHMNLKSLNVSDTGVDRVGDLKKKFPLLEDVEAVHSGRRVRVLEHLPELATFFQGTAAQKEVAAWQMRQVISLTPHLIAKRRTILRLINEIKDSIYHPRAEKTIDFVGTVIWRVESHALREEACGAILGVLSDLSTDTNISAEVLSALARQLTLLQGTLAAEPKEERWAESVGLLLHSLESLEQEDTLQQELIATTATIHAMAEELAHIPVGTVDSLKLQWTELLKSYTTVVNKILFQQVDDPVPVGDRARGRILRLLQASWAHQHCIYRLLENEGLDDEYRLEMLEAFLNSIENPFQAPAVVGHSFLGIPTPVEGSYGAPGPFTQTMMDYSLAIAIAQCNLPTRLRECVLRHVLSICSSYREARFPNLYRILTGITHKRDLPGAYRYNPLVRNVWEYEGLFEENINENLKQEFRTAFIKSNFGPKDELYTEAMVALHKTRSTPSVDREAIESRLEHLSRWYRRFMPGHRREFYFWARSALGEISLR